MNNPLVSVRNLRIKFAVHGAEVQAVRWVSFDIPPGSTVALVGESGSGKSVIARAIMGLLPTNAAVTAGQIIVHNPAKNIEHMDVLKLDPNSRTMRTLRGANMSLIFQEPMVSLSALHTIGDQISESLFLHRDISKQDGRRLTAEMLAIVGFPDARRALKLYPFELSGGMRQRAMIAMALICHPSLLIADEPTTALDVTIQAQILKLIKQLQSKLNMAVLMITHDLGVVANIAEQVIVLYHGEVMECGARREIFTNPRHEYTQALLNAVPRFDMQPGERLTPLREIKTTTGSLLQNITAADNNTSPPTIDTPILQVKHLIRSFGARSNTWSMSAWLTIRAVNDVSFELKRGETLGLVGESGSGKSTLGKLIARAIAPDSGQIIYTDNQNRELQVEKLDESELFNYRCAAQYIFQDPVGSLNPSMTLFDIIREPMEIHNLGGLDYQMELAAELMQLVGLDARHLRRYPHSFSGGQRQRIGIARALALRPQLLICDEPVSALDVSIQAQVLNLMKDLQKKLKLSYLFISHNLAVVDYIADRIAVMYRGELVEIAPRAALFANPTHPYTQTLLQAIPLTDLNKPLDFGRIADAGGDRQTNWQPPFATDEHTPGKLFEITPGHFVRATQPL